MIAAPAPPTGNAADFASAAALAVALTSLGIAFHRKGEDLALKDPQRRLTPSLVEAVRRHKPQLLTLADAVDSPPQRAPPVQTTTSQRTGTAPDAVLALVTEAAPISHTQIKQTLIGRGFEGGAVVEAITELQTRRRLICHDLLRGYILAS